MSKPGISVIIPCHDAGPYVEETVASVMQHNTTGVPMEVIIVDHNNKEGSDTKQALQRIQENAGNMPFPVKVVTLNDETHSPSAPRNLALDLAQYDYICPIDADDRYNNEPDAMKNGSYFQRVMDEFEKNPNLAIMVGGMRKFNAEGFLGKDPAWGAVPYSEKSMLLHNAIPAYGAYRREDALAAGGYDTKLDTREDQAFYLTLLSKRMDNRLGTEVLKIPDEYLDYRQLPDSVSKRDPKDELWFARVTQTADTIYHRNLPDIDWHEPVPDLMKLMKMSWYEQAVFDGDPAMVRWLADFNKYAHETWTGPEKVPLDERLQEMADRLDPPKSGTGSAAPARKNTGPGGIG